MGTARDERARVRGAQAGSVDDLEALFRVHWPRAFRAAYLVTHDAAAAEDIAQESFLAAMRALDRFDRRRPFGPWLHRIVVNRAIDWTRARKLRSEVELSDTVRAVRAEPAASRRPPRRARPPRSRAPGRRGDALPARVHARRDRGGARPPARDRQLAVAERARRAGGRAVKDELERVEIPGEEDAQARAWAVVGSAFEERVPAPRPSHWPRVAAIAIALAAVLASAFSPPGQAVIDEIREVVGVERAERALFSLPAEGRLLVASDEGVWVVQQDGSKRLLRGYREASWSPFGRFIVADGERTSSPRSSRTTTCAGRFRAAVSASPRWTGTETDTRIAYERPTRIRIVAGDGRRTMSTPAALSHRVAPAWRPGGFTLTYVDTLGRGSVRRPTQARDAWKEPGPSRRFRGPRKLEWSSDGSRLLLLTRRQLVVFGSRSHEASDPRATGRSPAAFCPDAATSRLLRRRWWCWSS